MNKNIPRLVDQSLIDSVINTVAQPIQLGISNVPTISTFKGNNIKLFLEKYWILVLIVLIIGGFIIYNKYFKNNETKEDFNVKKEKKVKKQKKVRIMENYNPSCPNCGDKQNCPNCNKMNGKMSEIEMPIEHLEHEQHIKHPSRQEHHIEHNTEPSHNIEQYNQHEQKIEQMYEQPQQQSYETTYHNQFYGQSITDDAQGMPRNDIETFNSNSIGNYVAF